MSLADAEKALADLGPKPYPLPLGDLAPVVEGLFAGLKKTDWVVCGPRERVGATLRGCSPDRLVDPSAGAAPYRLAPCTVTPGARALHAVGLAVSSGAPVACLLGPASAASGDFYEALNTAALLNAAVLFVVTTREVADDAPVARQTVAQPRAVAKSLGLTTSTCKPTLDAVSKAVAKGRGALHLIEIPMS